MLCSEQNQTDSWCSSVCVRVRAAGRGWGREGGRYLVGREAVPRPQPCTLPQTEAQEARLGQELLRAFTRVRVPSAAWRLGSNAGAGGVLAPAPAEDCEDSTCFGGRLQ